MTVRGTLPVAIDFTVPPEVEDVRERVRDFMAGEVAPVERRADEESWDRDRWVAAIVELRGEAKRAGLWLPHMPAEWGGMGLGHVAMAAVSAEAARTRIGPYGLAHCMRWIGQAETALEMMVARSLDRYSHGSILAEKQGIQWLIADSTIELYQAKLMVLHAAHLIDRAGNDTSVVDFRGEVSMAKHFVANALNRIIDRSIQVHGALGYSTDTPLAHMMTQARWARFADGADEIHLMRTAQRTIATFKVTGSTRAATGNLPL